MGEENKKLLGRYQIGRLLGKGNFAKVYHDKHIITNERVAIKVIKKDQVIKEEGMMEQIIREISVMRLVRHPNVVELKEVMATKTKIFVVMEYVRSGELLDKIARGRLKEDAVRKYFQQLISAVDFCHSTGVLHHDIKPENLLDPGKRSHSFSKQESMFQKFDVEEKLRPNDSFRKSPSPAILNAFQLISSMSTGFDSSNMFEDKRKDGSTGSKFTSRCSARVIIEKIEILGKKLGFKVAKTKDFKLRLLGPSEGRKGRLSVTAEVFKVAPEVTVVELSKFSGDTLEYIKFCDIRPALKDIFGHGKGKVFMINIEKNATTKI